MYIGKYNPAASCTSRNDRFAKSRTAAFDVMVNSSFGSVSKKFELFS